MNYTAEQIKELEELGIPTEPSPFNPYEIELHEWKSSGYSMDYMPCRDLTFDVFSDFIVTQAKRHASCSVRQTDGSSDPTDNAVFAFDFSRYVDYLAKGNPPITLLDLYCEFQGRTFVVE